MFGIINVNSEISVWNALESIDIDLIEKYLTAKKTEDEEKEKELKDYVCETYADVSADDALEKIGNDDIASYLEFHGYSVTDYVYETGDDFYENWETLAEDVSKLSYFDLERFFREFMRHKRMYRNEDLTEIIKNIKL